LDQKWDRARTKRGAEPLLPPPKSALKRGVGHSKAEEVIQETRGKNALKIRIIHRIWFKSKL
jgi:hypothetical protein